jgi:long-chain-fatty-acid--[acyl-carrier-protein] ligase
MKNLFLQLCYFLIRLLLRIRYRVTYKGLDEVKKGLRGETRGVLFLPNHPGFVIDPTLVLTPFLRSFEVRPLIVEYMFYNPFVHWVAGLFHALPVPDFHTSFNTIKQRRLERVLGKMSQGLKEGERFLIYPSGATKQCGREVLGGAFATHRLISENPDVVIVLVRTEGLWGSMFTRSLTNGEVPDLKKALMKAFWITLKNLIFFVPKRPVTVEYEFASPNFPREGSVAEVNHFLEEWYNAPYYNPDRRENLGEPLQLISYAFWKEEIPQITIRSEDRIELSSVPQIIKEQVITKIAELANVSRDKISPTQHLLGDLGLDSLHLAEIVTFLEENFDVRGIHPGELTTVSRVLLIAMKIYERPEAKEPKWNLHRWNHLFPQERVQLPDGETVPEVFLRMCDEKLFDVIAADPLSGPVTYRGLKMKALLLSDKIRRLPGERIGILLPSSVGVQVLVLACQLAGKTPVMINWTVGGRHLDTVVDVSGIGVVLTSWGFLDNLDNVDISRVEELLVVMEELRSEISFWDILKAEFMSYLSSAKILRLPKFSHLQDKRVRREAVILFTSGTEAMPKGVPLSHKNLLSDMRAVLDAIELSSNDHMLSFLPPFHSFGFAVTGLLPLLCGVKAIYYPNPLESKRLSKAVRIWQVTILPGAPTFLKNIMQVSNRETLASVRLLVSGAEKAPQEVFDYALKLIPHAQIVEGYGITECSPILTLNKEGVREFGVGRPIPGVELKIVDPETHVPLDGDAVGLVLVSGPNVFSGYLNKNGQNPFLEFGGSRWYMTGDLGKVDPDGHLILSGRQKRFVKVGGEMVSLAALEDAIGSRIIEESKQVPEGPQVAVCSNGENGRPRLTLFSTRQFEVFEVNHILREKGFSNLAKIDKVQLLEAIPMTATGKVAYRMLDKMVT